MQCPNCSAENIGGNFCTNCGSPLPSSEKVESLKNEALEPDAVEMPDEVPADNPYTPPTYNHAPGQGGSGAVPPVPPAGYPNSNYESAPTTPGYETSSQGILNQAWDDVIHDPSLVKKTLLLALISCVPILNFVVTGYGLRWGRRAAFRTGDTLPQKIFGDRAFEMGFFAFVVALAWGLVMGIVSIIPIAGFFIVLAAAPFLILAMMYMALVEEFGAAFRVKDLWEKGKRSYGGILAAAYVPGLVAGVIISIVASIFAMMLGISAIGAIGASGVISDAALVGIGGFSLLGLVITAFICGVIGVLANLISYRAFGYWVGRVAPEWVQESIAKGADPR